MDHFAETSAVHSSNQPKIDGILPDRKAGTRGSPGFHDVGV